MKRTVLYGCGYYYRSHLPLIEQMISNHEIEVTGICSGPVPAEPVPGGFTWFPASELPEKEFDWVLIMSRDSETEIIGDLVKMGITRPQIVPFTVFDLPDLTFPLYESIRERHISIFSSTCFGGILSRRFSIEHNSPFKNLWMSEPDYLPFLENPEYYLSLKPEFKRFGKNVPGSDPETYVVLSLGDLTIHCNHTSDPEQALSDWTRRAAKVNMDDLIVVLITDFPKYEERFLRLPYEHKYCFTGYESTHPESICLPKEDWMQTFDAAHGLALSFNDTYSITRMIMGEADLRYPDKQ